MQITRKNFTEEYENINNNLKRSCFVAFDAEFTALLTGQYRLFDTNEERYNCMKTEVSKMIMTQVGLTTFQYDRDEDSYKSVAYTFHLCPQVVGDINQSFSFQASTLRFLCRHNFDFNKFTYEGIPYASKEELKRINQEIRNNNLANYLSHELEMKEENLIQNHCSEVCLWLSSKEETMYIDVHNPVLRYLIHFEVRKRFPTVLTTNSLGNSNKILIYRDENVEGSNNAPMHELEEEFMKSVKGFFLIIELLEKYKKPLISHNAFLDVVILHNQFIGPLPSRYSDFKKNINSIFPVIFDTKYISHEMGKKLTLNEVWKSNALQDLYEYFAHSKCKKFVNGLNTITLDEPFKSNQTYHEAGWDSYCAGYCFIRLGHWAACENSGMRRPVGPTEMLAAMASFSNKVNVIRGATPYMNLIGDDPPTHRPKLLHIKSLRERVINADKVALALAAAGPADLRPCGAQALLVAPAHPHTAEKIVKIFRNSPEYKISTYNAYRHSAAGRIAIWSGALLTGSLLLLLLHREVKSPIYSEFIKINK